MESRIASLKKQDTHKEPTEVKIVNQLKEKSPTEDEDYLDDLMISSAEIEEDASET